MGRKKTTKALALGLSCAMLLSGTVYAESGDTAAEQEKITLTWGRMVADCSLGDGVHSETSAALKAIEEKTGITIEFVTYDQQKFNVLAASGDLPDIVNLWPDTAVFSSLISSEQILPLDDLLDAYGENIKENIPACIDQVNGLYGSVYYLPVCVSDIGTTPISNGYVNFQARYDIYKEIGSPEIHTEDDYLDVLKQMQDYQREQTGDNSIYAFSAWTDSGTWPYIITYPFSYGDQNYSSADNYSFNVETGELESNFMDEDSVFWNGIRFFNKAYTMGIFDPDGFTQKNTQYYEKIAQGKVLVNGSWAQPDPEYCGEDAICVRLPGEYFPTISGIYGSATPFGYGLSSGRAITSNCEYPERAMQLLNYLDSEEGARTLVNGIQGEDWDYIDGIPQFIGTMLEKYESGDYSDYRRERTGDGVGSQFLYSGTVKTESGYPIDLSTTEDFIASHASDAQKAFAQDYDESFSYPGQVYEKWYEEGMVTTEIAAEGAKMVAFAPALSDESSQIINEATDYFASNVAKLIMAEDEETFNAEKAAMIEKFKEIGYEEAEAEVMQNYETSLATYHEIFG